jgi:hypothetical protein
VPNAAMNGQLETLIWLRAHGCPWNKEMCIAEAGSEEVARWAEEH